MGFVEPVGAATEAAAMEAAKAPTKSDANRVIAIAFL
jgi:hypothetical protein